MANSSDQVDNATSHSGSQTTKVQASRTRSLMQRLPPWLQASLRDSRKWKTFIRCMIATLATLVLLLDQRTLDTLGQAAFFCLIVSMMLPPYMALSMYTFVMLTLVFGMLIGWAWGAAAMASALAARSQTLHQSQVERVQSKYDSSTNIDAQYQTAIFKGEFLDPRSSAVFGVFLFIGAYAFGYVRATKPRLTLGCIFATIVLDLMASYGALFPIKEYTLAKQLVIPALCYVGIGLASIVLLFPQTLNHMFIGAFVDQNLTPILHFLQLQNSILATLPSNHEEWSELAGKALDIRRSHVMGVQGLLGQKGLLELEVSRGRIGPGNLAKIFEKGRELGAKAYGLGSFVMVVEESNDFHRKRKESPSTHPTLRAEKVIQENDDQTSDSGTRLDDLIPLLESSTLPLRQAGEQSLLGLIDFFQEVNQYRWRKPPASKTISRIESLQTLKTALQEYRDSKHFEMLAPFSRLFDPTTGALVVRNNQGIRNLFRAFVMSNNLIAFSLTLIEFSEFVLDIEVKNPKSVFQFPSAFAKMLVESAGDKEGGGNSWDTSVRDISGGEQSNQSQETLVADDTEKQKKNKTTKYAMDPDASDPRNVFQKFGRKVAAVWGGVTSVEGAFALKYALVSVALWVPQVCPSSAYFVYTNRGLWALIMSQTGLGVFTGEQISSFILRMSGTVVGLVVGMVSWYTGAQLGTGNPYGVAASTMVFIAPFLYMRINAPQATSAFWIMSAVTFAFVIGYSWVDEHVFQLANQGAGAALAGRRGLLVIIGFTAGFLIMLFPKPTSAKLLLRRNFAKNITDIGDLYGKEVMVFDVGSHTDLEKKENQKQFRDHFLKIAGRLQGMQPQMGYAQAEPGLKHVFPLSSPVRRCSADDPLLRGPWPVAKYRDMMKVQIRILSAFANLSGAYSRLEPQWCNRLATKSDLLHPAFVADCLSLFALLQNSLRLGQRLPPTMMIFERLAYHRMNTAHHREAHPGVGDDARQEEERIEIETLGKELNWKSCHNEQLAVYATATVALTHITHGLNELHQLVISLVGEKDLDGFDKAQARWARKELAH